MIIDTLDIKGLRVKARIGVYAWEQRIMQSLLIDIGLSCDLSGCGDALTNTIDYGELCRYVESYLDTTHFQLIETVAEKIAENVMQQFKLRAITVTVSKPHAIKEASNISVTISRERLTST